MVSKCINYLRLARMFDLDTSSPIIIWIVLV